MVTDWRVGCLECGGEGVLPVCAACGRRAAKQLGTLRAAVRPLWEALERSEEEATTLAVGRALARIGGVEVAAGLRDWLLPRVPVALCPGSVTALLGELPDAAARSAATRIARENFAEKKLAGQWERVLAGLPTPEARATLIDALGHADETVRWSAIHAMLEGWEAPPGEAAPALRRLLMDEGATGEVQFCAAALLARMNDPEMGEECAAGLAEALEEAEGSVADTLAEPTIAAGILARREDGERAEAARRFLLRRLEGGSEAILSLALPPLLARPSRALVDALVDGCLRRRPKSPSALTFARSFGELADPALRAYAWERLSRLLGGDPAAMGDARYTLVHAAGALGCAEAVPVLWRIYERSADPLFQEAITEALARLGDAAAIDACVDRLLSDPAEAGVPYPDHAALAAALGGIADAAGRARAVAPLIHALNRSDLVRPAAEALTALRAWEPVDAVAEPTALEEPVLAAPAPVAEADLTPPALLAEPALAAPAPLEEPALIPPTSLEGPALTPPVLLSQRLGEGGAQAALEPDGAASGVANEEASVPGPAAAPAVPASPESDRVFDAVEGRVADLERALAQLPPEYFRYGAEAAMLLEKERTVMALLCEEVQPALDQLDGMGGGPEERRWAARAYWVKARLHHALTCDARARAGGDALRQRQRWDQAKLAEGAYWHVLSLADDESRRGRALFDLGVLLVETERTEEAIPLFDQVAALFGGRSETTPEGRLATAAGRYAERLRSAADEEPASDGEAAAHDPSWTGALHVARTALRGALVSAGGLAACGVFAWYAWAHTPRPAAPAVVAQRPAAIAEIEVTRGQAKVRTRRARGAQKVKTARRGERLTAIGRDDSWWKVQFENGVTGWIPTRYTREVRTQ